MLRVIKLGGSLLQGRSVTGCLDKIAGLSGKVAVVPGGGPFAEQVRGMQAMHGFDDVAAHRMAILAMQQTALLLHSLKPGFRLIGAVEELTAVSGAAVWSPLITELDSAGISPGWDITSDSLSAWLASRLGATELVLVKSVPLQSANPIPEMQRLGIVDAAFHRFAGQLACPVKVINIERFIGEYV